jgi:hypothetical protein
MGGSINSNVIEVDGTSTVEGRGCTSLVKLKEWEFL